MNAFLRWCLTVLFAAATISANVRADDGHQPRTALVIGNAAYSYGPLANSVNDAVDMAAALSDAGFDVILKTDADQAEMKVGIDALARALKERGGVGLFYFAGHGVQVRGENVLLPIGPAPGGEDELMQQSIAVSDAVDAMAAARDGLTIVILDACRNNPLTGAVSGLSRIDSNANLFVSYSTAPGAVALDGEGDNSPYTKHLAAAIGTPALTLEETFKRTLKGVYQETGGLQTPWMSSTFFGNFVFRALPGAGASAVPADPVALTRPGVSEGAAGAVRESVSRLMGVYRAEGINPNGSRYHGIVALTPEGDRVRFTWWIGKDTFTGLGEFAGRMLVVDWGENHPVVYSFNDGVALDGEWADGTATESLQRFSGMSAEAQIRPGGRYTVEGRNPDGSSYTGTVDIRQQGDSYHVAWQVGSSFYRGAGRFAGNVLAVEWGEDTPVVYALGRDGRLEGLWAGGLGEEILTPTP